MRMPAREKDRWVRPYLRRFAGRLVACAALGAAAAVCAMLLMLCAGRLVAQSADPATTLFQVMVPVACIQLLALAKPLSRYVSRLVSHDLVFRMASDLRVRLFATVAAKDAAWRRSKRFASLVASFIDDIGHVQDFYLRCVLPASAAAVAAFAACLVLGMLSWQLAVLAALFFVLEGCFLPLLALVVDAGADARAHSARERLCAQLADDVRGAADWAISGRATSRVFAYMDGEGDGQAARALQERLDVHARLRSVACAFLQAACIAAVLWWASGALSGAPAVGAEWMAALALALFPVAEACAPVSDAVLAGAQHRRRAERLNALDDDDVDGADTDDGDAAVDDANAVCRGRGGEKAGTDAARQVAAELDTDGVDMEDADAARSCAPTASFAPDAPPAPPAPPSLRVRGLSFTYDASALRVFDALDLDIPAGQHVAVLGRSGSGKSTLLSLLRGAALPDTGNVELVDVAGATVPVREKLPARTAAVMEQGSYVFARSIRENLQLADPEADDAALWRALEQARLTETVRALPDGLDAYPGEGGMRLSGGQRQRLVLARALVADAPVLLADEPFTALDADLEAALLDTVLSACAGKTLVLVTHHLAHVERFDRVLLLEKGRIAADGSPDELAASNPRFARLLALEHAELPSQP